MIGILGVCKRFGFACHKNHRIQSQTARKGCVFREKKEVGKRRRREEKKRVFYSSSLIPSGSFMRSAKVIESSSCSRTRDARCQTLRVRQMGERLQSPSSVTQSVRLMPPSMILTISPTVILAGSTLRMCPPDAPRTEVIKPSFFRGRRICSMNWTVIPVDSESMVVRCGESVSRRARSNRSRVA